MKNGLFYLGILIASLLLLTSFSIRENPQDPIRGGKKHITMVKVEDGKETKLDTVVEAGKVFVWEGDTIGADLKWISEDDMLFEPDSLKKFGKLEYIIKSDDDEEGKNMVMFITSDSDVDKLHEIKGLGKNFRVDNQSHTFIHSGHSNKFITTPEVKLIKEKIKGNVIDLSDPNIISFKKKKLSKGREKIEIIRNEAPDNKDENIEVIIETDEDNMIHPEFHKEIKVIKTGDGAFTTFEGDGEKYEMIDDNGNTVKVREIKEGNGNVFHIEEIKEKNAKKIKVTVTKEIEEKEKLDKKKQENN